MLRHGKWFPPKLKRQINMSRNLGAADFWGFIYVVSRLAIVAAVVYFLYLLRKILVKRGFFMQKIRRMKPCETTWTSGQQGR
ncbi:hypothetical protein CRD68_09070 [Listeria monocytogenes]|nr:hypothetical protein BB652_00775 [Listeria monocytogenes]OET81225.1 hypothetical protein AJL31_00075 [Listeria monocytogenes]OFG13003.1 hypothetical protein BJM41_01830 [Listeria monocytogenes]OTV25413.1 hypothetical protein BA757_04330 [Listeria monocytogenes]OTV29044.1 hypothetical protein BA758_12520 [Listeria monocytogenes]